MYLTFNKGMPIGFIRGGKYKKKLISITENPNHSNVPQNFIEYTDKKYRSKKKAWDNEELIDRLRKGTEEGPEGIRAKNDKGKALDLFNGLIEPIPNPDKRDVIYVGAPSGAGKTVFCATYAKNFKRFWPKKKIYLFSKVDEDQSIDVVKGIIRINLDQVVENNVNGKLLEDSLCIFDDCDTIRDDKVRKEVLKIQDDLLQTGRHNNIYIIMTSHLLNKGSSSRVTMQELNKIVIFPGTGSLYFIKYCLKVYMGLEKDDIKRIVQLPTRWVMLSTHHPRYYLYQTGVRLLTQ